MCALVCLFLYLSVWVSPGLVRSLSCSCFSLTPQTHTHTREHFPLPCGVPRIPEILIPSALRFRCSLPCSQHPRCFRLDTYAHTTRDSCFPPSLSWSISPSCTHSMLLPFLSHTTFCISFPASSLYLTGHVVKDKGAIEGVEVEQHTNDCRYRACSLTRNRPHSHRAGGDNAQKHTCRK